MSSSFSAHPPHFLRQICVRFLRGHIAEYSAISLIPQAAHNIVIPVCVFSHFPKNCTLLFTEKEAVKQLFIQPKRGIIFRHILEKGLSYYEL